MRHELEKGHRIFWAHQRHGVCSGTADGGQKGKTGSRDPAQRLNRISSTKAACRCRPFWKFIRCFLYSSTRRNIMVHVGGADMDYITIKEASKNWDISARQINYYCVAGRIPGAVKMGTVWLIPKGAQKPADRRFKSTRSKDGENKWSTFSLWRTIWV